MKSSKKSKTSNQLWPELPYAEFAPTAHLLHMGTQAIGKLKLNTPFEPEWANVPLWLSSRGLTTGPIPYKTGVFAVDIDLIDHQIICTTSWGSIEKFKLKSMSVAEFTQQLFKTLHDVGVTTEVNLKPQEIPHPVPLNQDTEKRPYHAELANAWWRIMLSSYQVMQRYHAEFRGKTQPIGLMWGTFDLRDARYKGSPVSIAPADMGYIRRNAMDEPMIETGWWSGTEAYPRAAYFSFTYPQPKGIEQAKIKPAAAHWDDKMFEFILDYEDVSKSNNPENDLFDFLESTYLAGAQQSGWDSKLIHHPPKPV